VDTETIQPGHQPRLWTPRQDLKAVFLAAPDPVDGLRGLSILMVILFHCFFILKLVLPSAGFEEFVSSTPTWLRVAFSFDKAVDIFFVVSGYLIGQALIGEHRQTGGVHFLNFYKRRFFRIVPLFWIALLFYGSFAWKGDLHSLLANLLFLENLLPSATKIVPVGWSLAVEVQFYVLAPLIVTLFGKYLLRGLLGLLIAAVLIRLFLLLEQPSFYEVAPLAYLTGVAKSSTLLDTIYYPTWARFGPLVLGLMTPMISERWAYHFHSGGRGLALAGATCLCVGLLFPSYASQHVENPQLNLLLLTLDRILVGAGIVAFLVLWRVHPEHSRPLASRLLANCVLTAWGRLVYPTYLFHLPFIGVAFLVVFQTIRPSEIQAASMIQVFGGFFVALALMMPAVLALHVLVERPFIRLGRRLT
jgi:peptidoglycan/LPS O-acetylase OafA/YrhL